MGELGELLRSTREAKGISLGQAEEGTRIRRLYLEALEAEDFEQMPAEVYVRGFLRNYALYLGLDPEKALALRGTPPEEVSTVSFREQLEEPLVSSSPLLPLSKILGVLVILSILIAAGWWGYQWYTEHSPFATPTATPTSTPTAAPTLLATVAVAPTEPPPTAVPTTQPTATFTATPRPPTATPEPTATLFIGVRVSVEVVERTWLEVTVDGEEVLRELLEPGVSLSWTGLKKVSFHCGNAGGVIVTVNGEEIGTLGNLGQVVDWEWAAP